MSITDQTVQDVEHVGLGCDPLGKGQFDCGQYSLLIVLQDQGKDIDHLAIATRPSQHLLLQSPEA